MKIWVDADACPREIKDILFRAAERRAVDLTLVANHAIPTPRNPRVTALQVPKGFDEADHEIVRRLDPGDLVITADPVRDLELTYLPLFGYEAMLALSMDHRLAAKELFFEFPSDSP